MARTRKKTKAAPAPKAKAKAAPVAKEERRVAKRRGRRRGLLTGLGHHEHERDILDQYLHEVSKTPLLTQKEEIALARKVRAGDQEAMQELVKRILRFVISVAKKYQNRGLPLTDLIGEGNVGLLTAARKPGDSRRAGAAGPHRPRAAEPHGRSLAHRADGRVSAPDAAPRADARGNRRRDEVVARGGAVARCAEYGRRAPRRAARSRRRPFADRALHRRGSAGYGRSGDGSLFVGRNRAGAQHAAAARCKSV
ncbi:MAG: hypothetical protein E6H62_10055, partial [Betaproteobacteria bacterium]